MWLFLLLLFFLLLVLFLLFFSFLLLVLLVLILTLIITAEGSWLKQTLPAQWLMLALRPGSMNPDGQLFPGQGQVGHQGACHSHLIT